MQWLKLQTDILDDDKINIIRAMPEGDSLFTLWIGMLCIAMRKETDELYIADGLPYNAKSLARQLRLDAEVVTLGLQTFEKLSMIRNGSAITINNFTKHQALDKVQHMRKLTAERMRKYRKRLKEQTVTHNSVTSDATEKELDIDKDKKESRVTRQSSPNMPTDMKDKIVKYLNDTCKTNFRNTTQTTINHLNARYREGWTSFEDYQKVIDIKKDEWFKSDKMYRYLRPDTLFGTKFEAYRNEVVE